MNFALSEDHELLRDSARSFLDKEIDLAPLLVPGASGFTTRIAACVAPVSAVKVAVNCGVIVELVGLLMSA